MSKSSSLRILSRVLIVLFAVTYSHHADAGPIKDRIKERLKDRIHDKLENTPAPKSASDTSSPITAPGDYTWPREKAMRGKKPSTAISANDVMWEFFKKQK